MYVMSVKLDCNCIESENMTSVALFSVSIMIQLIESIIIAVLNLTALVAFVKVAKTLNKVA